MFGFSILPHDTITTGSGPTIVPAFNLLFIFLPLSTFSLRKEKVAKRNYMKIQFILFYHTLKQFTSDWKNLV
jgi:hypothetical protein